MGASRGDIRWLLNICLNGIVEYIFKFLYTRLQTGRFMVLRCPSVRPSIHPSVRPGLRPSVTVFRTFLLHALTYWAEILHITFYEHSMKFKCRQFPSIFVGVMPLLELKILEIHSFLLHALTYWTEILHMSLLCCTIDQVWISLISVNICRSYAPFWYSNTGNTQFSALFFLIRWHIELKFCIWLCFNILQIKLECRQFPSIFVGVMPLLELKILEIHSFPQFSPTCFDI